jgi:hypothetical protein
MPARVHEGLARAAAAADVRFQHMAPARSSQPVELDLLLDQLDRELRSSFYRRQRRERRSNGNGILLGALFLTVLSRWKPLSLRSLRCLL